ncbi:ribonuclease P protein component [Crocinitomix sp.]|nr:ribonuclease P protein component [Crocinitomix sp.]
MKNSFKKSERLKSKIAIEAVFAEGIVIKKHPLIGKFISYEFSDKSPLKMVVSVPKRRIPKATKRNRIRRQIKEAYRLNKKGLKDELLKNGDSLALFLIYTGKENPDYSIIEEKIKLILEDIQKNYRGE